MVTYDLNWLAVVVAAVTQMILGFLWYGPIFGKTWLAAMAKTQDQLTGAGMAGAVSAGAALITAIALGLVINNVGATTIGDGVIWGVILSAGLVVTSQISNAMFEQRSGTVVLLYSSYQVVGTAMMGAIIAGWQ